MADKKQCGICGVTYEKYNQKGFRCRECKREYDRNYYRKSSKEKKKTKKKNEKLRKDKIKNWICEFLSNNPCSICGESRILCLHFDHIDPKNKKYEISGLVNAGASMQKIEKEISKCRVLCANCHAIHTAHQFSYYKTDYLKKKCS